MAAIIPKDATLRDVRSMLPKAESFVRKILGVMLEHKQGHGPIIMRLGITGTGQAPNYRLENTKGQAVVAIDGVTHTPWPAHERFDSSGNWSTATMTEEDIKQLIAEIRPFAPKARNGRLD